MKEYIVSLNFLADTSSKDLKLFQSFKDKGFDVSCHKEDKGFLWRIESMIDECEPLSDHIKSIANSISPKLISDNKDLFKDVYFDIGVCYDTYTCSISFEKGSLNLIHELSPDIGIEISCYPSDEE